MSPATVAAPRRGRALALGPLLLQALPAGRAAEASTLAQAPRRPKGGTFVQLFEWSWEDVALECELWLGPKGFAAVQISPPNEHLEGYAWFNRYQPVSYNLTSRSGNEAAFRDMLKRCRSAGVDVYADAVFNHMAGPWGGVGVAGTPFEYRTYPMYEPTDFHHAPETTGWNCGVLNYDDKDNVQNCDLAGMPDLCTGCPKVQRVVAGYINRMAEMGIAGFRVDAAKHQDVEELAAVLAKVNSSLFRFQEVLYGGVIEARHYVVNGPVTEFAWGRFVAPRFGERGQLGGDLLNLGDAQGFVRGEDAVIFLDNHDTQRDGTALLTHKTWPGYYLANLFMLAHPYGYPRIMSSYYFEDKDAGPPNVTVHLPDGTVRCGPGTPWVCEHRAEAIANMVAWRRSAGDDPITAWYAGGDKLGMCRGAAACIALNQGDTPWKISAPVPLPAGEYCDVIRSTGPDCPVIKVVAGASVDVEVPPGGALAYHVGALRPAAAAALRGGRGP